MPTSSAVNLPDLPPDQLGAYSVIRALTPETSFLCLAEGGRQVVLKKLEADCLLQGQLHPSIKERLLRVRELPQKHVAILQTVERIDNDAYLVWEYVDGQTFEDYTAATSCTPRHLSLLAREVILSIEAMHSQGIVHGSVHGRNVIIDSGGRASITHISPLLYNDPAQDTEAVLQMLRGAVTRRSAERSPLGEFIVGIDASHSTLRQLAARLAVLSDSAAEEGTVTDKSSAPKVRRRALIGAAVALACGVGIAAIFYFTFAQKSATAPTDFGPLDTVSSAK